MSRSRDIMIAELKRTVVPVLRGLGFRGSFPHFRRVDESQVEMLTFQFSSAGGEFVVEIGKFPLEGYRLRCRVIPACEVKMSHLLRRFRLGAKDEDSDHWFNYKRGDYGEVAESVVSHLRGQALEWWRQG